MIINFFRKFVKFQKLRELDYLLLWAWVEFLEELQIKTEERLGGLYGEEGDTLYGPGIAEILGFDSLQCPPPHFAFCLFIFNTIA